MVTSSATTIQRLPTTEAARIWERHRRLLVYLTFAIYWLVIFEGSLRKWAFPQYGRYLYFIKDPFVLLFYFLAVKGHFWPRKTWFLTFGALFSVASLFLIVVQARLADLPFSWLVAGFGWRMYFLYLPLPFLIARVFQRKDFDRLVRQTLLFAIPMAVLVYFQSLAPASAPINAGFLSSSEDKIWLFHNGNAIRTSGTFTSPLGQSYFSLSLVAMLMATWLVPRSRRPIRGITLLLVTAAMMTCVLLSGSRSTLMGSSLIIFICGIGLVFVGRHKLLLKSVAALVILTPVFLWIATSVYPVAIENTIEHWRDAQNSEEQSFGQFGVVSRALFGLYGFTYLLPQTPPQGFGLGLATNAAPALTVDTRRKSGATIFFSVWFPKSEQRFAYETGLGRQIIDLGPVFGLLFIAFRWTLLFSIAVQAFRAARRAGDVTPIAIFAFVATPLCLDAITANATAHAYIWVFVGFALATAHFTVDSAGIRAGARVLPVRRRLTGDSGTPAPRVVSVPKGALG